MHANHVVRRQRLMAQLGDGIALIATAPEVLRNADNPFPFRADSHFYYLSGFTEPQAVLLLDANAGTSTLFCRASDPAAEVWTGTRFGPERAAEAFGFDAAYPIDELDTRLPALLAGHETVCWALGRDSVLDARVHAALATLRERERSGVVAPARFADVLPLIDEMRLFKDAGEIALLRRAGRISADAHIAAMRATRPGRYEYEVEAELIAEFCRHGARSVAYESIVAGGANACTLHYVGNMARLNDGEMLLIDAGCEFQGYAGDITRTFPVNGRFSAPQRALYEVVLAAQLAAIATIRPGASLAAPADAALQVLCQGLIDLGLLRGSVAEAIDSGAYRRFYMHGIGHFIGLDVHDVGRRKDGDSWRTFAAGMATTVEPGLYIRAADDVPAAFHGIGIRIEDDVLVTEHGHEVYTDAVPKSIAEIEALMVTA